MIYDFKASFTNFIWLKSGALFKNLDHLDIEMVNGGAYGVEVYRLDETLVGKSQRPNQNGGWASFYFRREGDFGGAIFDGEYKIKLKNLAPGRREVRSGQLWYDG